MLFRSAFWLVAAYLVIQPQGVDFDGAAEAMTAEAMATGQRMVIEHVLGGGCLPMDCLGLGMPSATDAAPGREAVAAAPDAPPGQAPIPRPRLARAG